MASLHSASPRSAAAGPRRAAALLAGDAAAFMVFAAIGRTSHGEAAGLEALLQVAATGAPFFAGWVAAAALLGAYGPRTAGGLRPMLARVAPAWLLAWPIGLGLRALMLQRGIPISFAIVTLVSVMVILGIWRGAFALAESRRA